MMARITLFSWGNFKSHSGDELGFKINCDALSDVDLDCLAEMIAGRFSFFGVVGVPDGGRRLSDKLQRYIDYNSRNLLIVDDVLTTGRSMNIMKAEWIHEFHQDIVGVVIFARGECPDWVTPVFKMW